MHFCCLHNKSFVLLNWLAGVASFSLTCLFNWRKLSQMASLQLKKQIWNKNLRNRRGICTLSSYFVFSRAMTRLIFNEVEAGGDGSVSNSLVIWQTEKHWHFLKGKYNSSYFLNSGPALIWIKKDSRFNHKILEFWV